MLDILILIGIFMVFLVLINKTKTKKQPELMKPDAIDEAVKRNDILDISNLEYNSFRVHND